MQCTNHHAHQARPSSASTLEEPAVNREYDAIIASLREQLALFQSLLDQTQDAMVVTTTDLIIVYANATWQQQTGSDGMPIGQSLSPFFPEQSHAMLITMAEQTRTEGHVQHDIPWYTPNRHMVVLPMRSVMVQGPAGQEPALAFIINQMATHVAQGTTMLATSADTATETLPQVLWQRMEPACQVFQSLVENSPDALVVSSLDRTILYANPAAKAVSGYGDALVGMCSDDLSLQPPEMLAQMHETILNEGSWHGIVNYQRRDGEIIPSFVTGFVIRDQQGQVWAVAGSGRDISEQLQMAEALHESQALLQAFLEHVPVPTMVRDWDSRFLLINSCGAALVQRTPQEMIGQTSDDLLPPDVAFYTRQQDRYVMETGETIEIQQDIAWMGGLRSYLVTKFPLYDGRGNIYAVGDISIDMTHRKQIEEALRQDHDELELRVAVRTEELSRMNQALQAEMNERKRAEQALRMSEERYQRAVNAGRVGVWDWDIASDDMYLAPNLKAMLGYADHEMLNYLPEWMKHVHPADVELVQNRTQDYLAGRLPTYEFEHRMCHRDGTIRWIAVRGRVTYDEAGTPIRLSGTDTDITEKKLAEEELRQSQQLITRTFASMRDAVFIIDANTVRIMDCNPAATDIFGYSRAEMLGYTTSFLHSDSVAVEEWKRHLLHGVQQTHRMQLPAHAMKRKDGALLHTEHSVMPLEDHEGQHIGWVDVVRDITQRVQAEQALRESEKRYRTLVETSPEAILLTNLDGTLRFCNQRAVELFGYSSCDELCHTVDADGMIAPEAFDMIQRMAAIDPADPISQIETRMRHRDGRCFPAEVSSALVIDADNTPTGLIIMVQDISERKQAEADLTRAYRHLADLNEHLTRSHDLLRAIFDGLEHGLVLLDSHNHIQMMNQALAAMMGSSPSDLMARCWEHVQSRFLPFETDTVVAPLSKTDDGSSTQQRVRYQRPDGIVRILDLHAIRLHGPHQLADQTIVQVIDVTWQVQLQARVIGNERFAASGRLAASVAHEINTPLQALQNSLHLSQIAPAHERETFLQLAMEEMERVGHIVNQLLSLYRPGALKFGPVDVNMLFERILLLIGKRLRDNSIVVERDLSPDLPPLRGRADEVMQVLLNLMVNALDAMPDGGMLRVGTAFQCSYGQQTNSGRHQGMLMITITDNGCGIAPELQQRIFEPFVTTREDGTGLGLAISAQIVRQYGGTLRVESVVGQGSTFTVQFPLHAN